MRLLPLQNILVVAVTLAVIGGLAAYVRSEPPPTQTLTEQGEFTPRTRAIVRGENAYLPGPPEVVTDLAGMDTVAISPDGGAVLVAGYKTRPYRGVALSADEVKAGMAQRFPELNVVYWDVRTRVARTLFRESVSEEQMTSVAAIHWYPQTRVALLTLKRTAGDSRSRTLMQVNTATGAVTRLAEMTPDQSLFVSPRAPMAFVYTEAIPGENAPPDTASTIRFLTPQGMRPALRLSEEIGPPDWMPDGASLYAVKRSVVVVDGKRTVRKQYSLLDVNTGRITHPDTLPLLSAQNATASDNKDVPEYAGNWLLEFADTTVVVPDPAGRVQSVPVLWLRPAETATMSAGAKPTPVATTPAVIAAAPKTTGTPVTTLGKGDDMLTADALLVATNAHGAGFLFTKNSAALLFTREGTLCAAPIFRIPVAEFTRALRQVQRTATMSNAKQIGLGIMMYSQDYDEVLPQPGSAVADSISPYLRSKSAFENPASGEFGFTYAYKGNTSLPGIANPATTPLGYLSGAGGRAILWTDGHVTWEDGP